jgi:hypothetical protein
MTPRDAWDDAAASSMSISAAVLVSVTGALEGRSRHPGQASGSHRRRACDGIDVDELRPCEQVSGSLVIGSNEVITRCTGRSGPAAGRRSVRPTSPCSGRVGRVMLGCHESLICAGHAKEQTYSVRPLHRSGRERWRQGRHSVPDPPGHNERRHERGPVGAYLWIPFVVPPALILLLLGLQWLEMSLLGESLRHRVRTAVDRVRALSRDSRPGRINRRRGALVRGGRTNFFFKEERVPGPVGAGRQSAGSVRWRKRMADRTRRLPRRRGAAARPRRHR